jgi:hypothetical protein
LEEEREKKRRRRGEVEEEKRREDEVGVSCEEATRRRAESGWWIGEGKNQLRSVWLARRGELTHLEVSSSDCDVLEFGLSGCNSGKINAVLWTAGQGRWEHGYGY